METRIEIPVSKTKTALLLIVPLCILILGPIIFLRPESFITSTFNDIEKIKVLGIVGGVVGLLLLTLILKKWLTKKTGFIIDKTGVTDLTNASYPGLIEWKDIKNVEGKKVGPIKLIILHIENPEKYINKAKKTSIRQMKKNLNIYGSPLLIVSSRLKIKSDDLIMQITNEFQKSKGHTSNNKTN